ncbi:MAG: choice-of-anchor Q domain-containing protein [Limisphaerales bacterium]
MNKVGGGAWCESTNVVISNCVFSNNVANLAGGGVKKGKLNNCVLTKNAARTVGGGADSSVLSNCTLSNNFTGIYSPYLPQDEITPLFITDNSGAGAAKSWLDNCLLTGNQAIVGVGGAATSSQLVNCKLIGNLAYYGAGADSSTLNNCLIVSNSAYTSGGGTYGGALTNCLISGNYAGEVGGGGFLANLDNCTIIKNSSPKGAGVAGGMVHNAVVYFNSPENFDNITYISPMSYCCTTPTHTGIGNFTNNPAFVDVAMDNFRLQTNSPCINVGNGSSSATDLDGRPRIVGGQIDLGAYEFQGVGIGEFIAWLQQYGISTGGAADYLNADGDGLNNWQEWIAGTIPTNASSVLLLAPPANTLAGVTVTWQSVSNRTYYLQASTNLTAQFISIQSNLVGQTGSTSYVDMTATNGASYFYRVGVQ